MEMPALDVLQEQNIYSGGEEKLRFKVVPDKETMKVTAYREYCLEYCREHGLVLGETELPITEQGMKELAAWLEERKIESDRG